MTEPRLDDAHEAPDDDYPEPKSDEVTQRPRPEGTDWRPDPDLLIEDDPSTSPEPVTEGDT